MRSNIYQLKEISGRTLYDSSSIKDYYCPDGIVFIPKAGWFFILLRVRIPLVAAGTFKPKPI